MYSFMVHLFWTEDEVEVPDQRNVCRFGAIIAFINTSNSHLVMLQTVPTSHSLSFWQVVIFLIRLNKASTLHLSFAKLTWLQAYLLTRQPVFFRGCSASFGEFSSKKKKKFVIGTGRGGLTFHHSWDKSCNVCNRRKRSFLCINYAQ